MEVCDWGHRTEFQATVDRVLVGHFLLSKFECCYGNNDSASSFHDITKETPDLSSRSVCPLQPLTLSGVDGLQSASLKSKQQRVIWHTKTFTVSQSRSDSLLKTQTFTQTWHHSGKHLRTFTGSLTSANIAGNSAGTTDSHWPTQITTETDLFYDQTYHDTRRNLWISPRGSRQRPALKKYLAFSALKLRRLLPLTDGSSAKASGDEVRDMTSGHFYMFSQQILFNWDITQQTPKIYFTLLALFFSSFSLQSDFFHFFLQPAC